MSTEITVSVMIIILFASCRSTLGGGGESGFHFLICHLDFSVDGLEKCDFRFHFTTEILKG